MPERNFVHMIALLAMLLFCPVVSFATPESSVTGTELSLRQAVVQGLQTNLGLQASAQQIPIAEAGIAVAQGRFDPLLFADSGAGNSRTPPTQEYESAFERRYHAAVGLQKTFRSGLSGDITLGNERIEDDSPLATLSPYNRSYLVLDLTQPLLRDFGTAANTTEIALGQNELARSTNLYMDRASRLGAEIEVAYLRLALAREKLLLRIKARSLASDLLSGNKQEFAAGTVPISEVQEAQTAVASRNERVIAARQDVETANNTLLDLMEVPAQDPLRTATLTTGPVLFVAEKIPAPADAFQQALDQRPDLAATRLEVESKDIRLRYADNQMLPRLDLEATLGLNGLSGDKTGVAPTEYDGGYLDATEGMAQRDGYQWYAGVRFSYPLGNRTAQARHDQAAVQKKQTILKLKRLEDTIDTEVRNALVAVNRSNERIEVSDHLLQLAQTTLQQEMIRLKEGLSDTFRVLKFQNDLIDAELGQLDARIDYQLGLVSLYRSMGTNLAHNGILLQPSDSFAHSTIATRH